MEMARLFVSSAMTIALCSPPALASSHDSAAFPAVARSEKQVRGRLRSFFRKLDKKNTQKMKDLLASELVELTAGGHESLFREGSLHEVDTTPVAIISSLVPKMGGTEIFEHTPIEGADTDGEGAMAFPFMKSGDQISRILQAGPLSLTQNYFKEKGQNDFVKDSPRLSFELHGKTFILDLEKVEVIGDQDSVWIYSDGKRQIQQKDTFSTTFGWSLPLHEKMMTTATLFTGYKGKKSLSKDEALRAIHEAIVDIASFKGATDENLDSSASQLFDKIAAVARSGLPRVKLKLGRLLDEYATPVEKWDQSQGSDPLAVFTFPLGHKLRVFRSNALNDIEDEAAGTTPGVKLSLRMPLKSGLPTEGMEVLQSALVKNRSASTFLVTRQTQERHTVRERINRPNPPENQGYGP